MAIPELERLMDVNLKPEELREIITSISPRALAQYCLLLANHSRRLHTELGQAREERDQTQEALEALRQPPLYPGTVLDVTREGRLEIVSEGRRQILAMTPELQGESFQAGDEILLCSDSNMVVGRNDTTRRCGRIVTVAEVLDGQVLIHGVGDETLAAMCPPQLLPELRAGDRVLIMRDFPCLLEKLPEPRDCSYLLEQAPDVSFDDIGGLKSIIDEICRDLDLHLLHRERLQDFDLRLLSGLLLVGPPGVGKTLIAKAIANYLAKVRADTSFLNVRPGELRGIYYGQAEAKIQNLFAVARAAPGLVVIFMDELDHFGSRGAGIGQDIDGRVMGALLAEIDGLDPCHNVLCVASTNRLDLCDTALVRNGRFGDRVYHVPRPGREATQQILQKYLTVDLPYGAIEKNPGDAAVLVEQAVSYLHAPRGGAGTLATVTMRNSDRYEIKASHVLSGALLASAVERAKHAAAFRSLECGGGITSEDVLSALDEALSAEAHKLEAPHVARQMLDLPGAEEIVHVELPPGRKLRRHRYLRAA